MIKSGSPVFSKNVKIWQTVANLPKSFDQIGRETGIPAGDSPNVVKFQKELKNFDLTKIQKLNQGMIDALDEAIGAERWMLFR